MKKRRLVLKDERGRFAPGNSASPGRPTKKIEMDYLYATHSQCTVGEWSRIVRRAVRDAIRGDGAARTFLLRALGLERVRVGVDTPVDDNTALLRHALSTMTVEELKDLRDFIEQAGDKHDTSNKLH